MPPTNESCIVTIESKSKKLEREKGGLDDKLISNIELKGWLAIAKLKPLSLFISLF